MTDINDVFGGRPPSWDSPATHAVAVTPNDSADLAAPARALFVGTGGNVKVTTWAGDTVTFANIPDGAILPVAVVRVFATDTTADDILALS